MSSHLSFVRSIPYRLCLLLSWEMNLKIKFHNKKQPKAKPKVVSVTRKKIKRIFVQNCTTTNYKHWRLSSNKIIYTNNSVMDVNHSLSTTNNSPYARQIRMFLIAFTTIIMSNKWKNNFLGNVLLSQSPLDLKLINLATK